MTKRVYRLTARFGSYVDNLGEFETYEAALDQLAIYRQDSRRGLWHDLRIDEYVDGVWQHRPTPPPQRRILKPIE